MSGAEHEEWLEDELARQREAQQREHIHNPGDLAHDDEQRRRSEQTGNEEEDESPDAPEEE